MNYTEFVLVGTQIVKEAAYDRGAYRISCHDIQRAARKDIFDLASDHDLRAPSKPPTRRSTS